MDKRNIAISDKDLCIDWKSISDYLISKERVPAGISNTVSSCIDEAKNLVRPKVISVEKKVQAVRPGSIGIEGGISFSGKKLSSYLKKAISVHFFLVTLGGDLENAASRNMADQDMLAGYLLDRIGSYTVEALAQKCEDALRQVYASTGSSISMRMSPGYCDWPVEEQVSLDKVLGFSKAGVHLTESCMMVPKKSISAMVGVGPEGVFSKSKSQCAMCDRRKNCDYSRA